MKKELKRKSLKRKQKKLKWIQVVVKRSQKVLTLEVMELGLMMPVTQQVMETPTNQLASPSNLKIEPDKNTVRRGGWNVHGGLLGRYPPKQEPVFANSDSN